MVAISRNYSRQSIILTEQDGGFRADNSKVPAGYSKIEVKSGNGMLTAFAQNLKYFADGSYIYKFFIAKTDPQPVLLDLGTLVIDDRGKGEGVWKFDAHNVEKTGYGIDKFDLFGIMARKKGNGAKGLICPLAGSTGKMPLQWREALVSSSTGYDTGDTGNEAAEGKNGYTEPGKEDGENPTGTEKETPEVLDAEAPVQEAENTEKEADTNMVLQEYMSDMLDSFPKVEPFEVPLENCIWWKVNTFNYIFGIMNDSARKLIYYAYGVPGVYNSQIKRQMEMYGFYSWRPAKREEKKQGDYGYWLAFVDARTGMLVNPQLSYER
ncbi:MAG: hypothetical protein HPY66_0427 [Firmicutes bacterium]|nr:hypothetical protein [Bacillota bacterium]